MTFTACVSLWKASIHVSVLYFCCENMHLLCFPLPKRQECCMWNKPKFSQTRGRCSHFHNFIFCCGKIFFAFIAVWILYFFFHRHHFIIISVQTWRSAAPYQNKDCSSSLFKIWQWHASHSTPCLHLKHITLTHETYCFWSNLVQCKVLFLRYIYCQNSHRTSQFWPIQTSFTKLLCSLSIVERLIT